MGLTKVSGDVIQGTINVGVVTATRIDGNVSGNVNSTGVSTFTTLRVGTAVTISGGIVTATSFVGNITGNVTGNATGLSGTPNITVGNIIASSATISGNVSVAGTVTYDDVTNVDSLGVGTFRSGIVVNTGTASTALVVNGSSRITGILSVGQGTITINGNTDKITTPKLDYAGISSTITATAVDVFVYDTRKDSDGGAWRKRTQHTSWYNETLNTATRGSRRDFPAVAVIVATADDVFIYDGDDPDLPLWMKFIGSSGARAVRQGMSSITMLNGLMTAGRSGSERAVGFVNFVSDYVYQIANNGKYEFGTGGILNRNTDGSFINVSSSTQIVNNTVNDVAMTVLPNAPIDSTTGLPVPTIAVATQAGISIITDSGTIYNLTPESEPSYASIKNFYSVGFDSNQKLFFTDSQTTSGFSQLIYLPNYNYNQSLSDTYSYLSGSYNYAWDSYTRATTSQVGYWAPSNSARLIKPSVATRDSIAIGYTGSGLGGNGLSLIGQQDNYLMNCGITTTFNTGWLYGYTQGAFLSDTSTASVTGTELNQYGDFASTTGWGSRSAAWTISGGVASVSSGAGYQLLGTTSGTLTNGRKYAITVNVTAFTAGRLELSQANSSNIQFNLSSTGLKTLIFTYTGTSGQALGIYGYGDASYAFTIDDLYVRELSEADRSVNNTGLAVYGTITKTAVATGADLVCYSGFTASNHLRQPPNSGMNIGTGDAHEMIWFKTTTTSGVMMLISYEGGANGTTDYGKPFNIRYENGIVRGWASHNNFSTYDDVSHGVSTADGTWHHVAWVKRGQVFELYVDGKFIGSDTGAVGSNALSDGNTELVIGARKRGKVPGDSEEPFVGSLALARIGKSAPSPDQILKIYNDEKALFQENSKATLYGTSSSVTALAYDDSTRLLYAGTSSGRSDFQGLERINNTTTAVTTAISASNGLVAEQ